MPSPLFFQPSVPRTRAARLVGAASLLAVVTACDTRVGHDAPPSHAAPVARPLPPVAAVTKTSGALGDSARTRLLPEPAFDRSDSFTADTVSDLALAPQCSGVVDVQNTAVSGTDVDIASGNAHMWIHVPGRVRGAPYGVASVYLPGAQAVRLIRRGFVILQAGPPACDAALPDSAQGVHADSAAGAPTAR